MNSTAADTIGETLLAYGAYIHFAAGSPDYSVAVASALVVACGRRLAPAAAQYRGPALQAARRIARTRAVRVGVIGAVAVCAVVGPVAAVTPAVALPVGVAQTTGASMGTDAQLIVYVDQPVERGDVVVYDAGAAGFIGHRAVRETSEGWVTQGDAREQPDQPALPYATAENIRGVVVVSVGAPLS